MQYKQNRHQQQKLKTTKDYLLIFINNIVKLYDTVRKITEIYILHTKADSYNEYPRIGLPFPANNVVKIRIFLVVIRWRN